MRGIRIRLACVIAFVVILLVVGGARAEHRGIPFEPGDRLTTEITPAGEVDVFVFQAVPGTVLTLKITPGKGSDLVPTLQVLAPNAGPVALGGALKVKKGKVQLKKLVLDRAGVYAVVVGGEGGTVGAYEMKTEAGFPKGPPKLKKVPFAAGADMDIELGAGPGASVKVKLEGKGGEGLTATAVAAPGGGEVAGAAAALESKKRSLKGSFTLATNAELGVYTLQIRNGAAASSLSGRIKVKWQKPRKLKRTLPATEPRIDSVAPAAAHLGSEVTVTGTNLTAATRVWLGESEAVSTWVSTTEIRATVPTGTGTVDVAVIDDDGQGNVLNAAFTFDTSGPTATIDFPPPFSKTDTATLTVLGTTESTAGVAAVRVNGVAVTTTDAFATWRVSVALAAGVNTLTVETEDTLGNVEAAAASAQVHRTSFAIGQMNSIAYDATNARALVLKFGTSALYGMAPSTGLVTVLSDYDTSVGTGPEIEAPVDLVHDAANGRALVLDAGSRAVYTVDLATGNRVLVSGDGAGSGTDFVDPEGLAYDAAGGRVLVTDNVLDALLSVDLTTGARTVISDDTTGTGPQFGLLVGVAHDAANGRALVPNGTALLAVDLSTGNRTVISDPAAKPPVGTGDYMGRVEDVVLDAANGRAFVTDWQHTAVLRIDLATGNRTRLAIFGELPRDLDYDAANGRVFAVTQAEDRILQVAVSTGAITYVTDLGVGTGDALDLPGSAGFDVTTGRVIVVDGRSVVGIDWATGNRTVISDDVTGSGYLPKEMSGGVVDLANRRVIVCEDWGLALVAVDLDTGARTVLSDDTKGTGPDINRPTEVVLDAANGRALVMCSGSDQLLAVNLTTGDRTVVSDAATGTGTGPAFDRPQDLALDATNGRAIVVDHGLDAVLAVDLATGNRSELTSDTLGTGVELSTTWAAVVGASDTIYAMERTSGILFEFDPADGDRTVISQRGAAGSGCEFRYPQEMDFAPSGRALIVVNTGPPSVFVVEPVSGDRVILSK